ncbi:PREDICTED: M protein, serotype 5-like [Priapulus caudatus]|uniref:M protein, serotype 5-like n=1 Tax=Priapulus caudatus TaxID=37621 RepID=A0ABM1EQP5_PRICU|nr:PREDICTED: M protein, serotype 5-like [Priapulus caudatus]
MEKEDDLSLLQNINYLRKQLAETEDCLQSISSIELNGSLQHEQRLNSTEISHPDTTDDDAQAEEIYRELSSTLTPSEQQRRSLRSERGFRGNGNGVAAEDHHRKVALLRRDNRQLMLENRNLLQQLDGRSSELHEVRRKVEHMLLEKHDAPSRKAVLELNSKLCDSLDRQAQDQDLISSLRENISQLVAKLDQSSILKAKADEQKNEAVHAMEDFAKTFQLYKEKTKHQLEENDGINSKLKEIINERDHLQHQVSLLGNEVELARKQTKKLRDAAGVAADDAADVIVDLRRQLSSQERQIDEMQERQIAEAEARERSDADASHGSGVTAGDRSVRILETGLEIAERLQVANARLREENEALRVATVTTARARDVAAATPPPAIAGELRRERERAAAARADCEREVARSRALEGKLVQVRALARAAAGKVELLTEQAAAARRELAACQAKLGEAEKQASQRESTEKSLRNQLQVRSRANQSLKVKLEEAVTEVALKVKGQEVASEKLKVARREVKDMQARSQLAENERAERQKEWQGLNMTLRQEVAEREEKISQLGAILTQREADVIKVQDASERIQDSFNDYQNVCIHQHDKSARRLTT